MKPPFDTATVDGVVYVNADEVIAAAADAAHQERVQVGVSAGCKAKGHRAAAAAIEAFRAEIQERVQ